MFSMEFLDYSKNETVYEREARQRLFRSVLDVELAILRRTEAMRPGGEDFAARVADLVEQELGKGSKAAAALSGPSKPATQSQGDQVADLVEQQIFGRIRAAKP